MKVIETERLILRTWDKSDVDEYYRINQDPKVIEFLLGPMTIEQVSEFIANANQEFKQRGFSWWALEEKSSGRLMGFYRAERNKVEKYV